MPIKFKPTFTITSKIAKDLMRIEAVKQVIVDLPITAMLMKKLRNSSLLDSIHYSTKIEGNRLTPEEVERVILEAKHVTQKKRDEQEVKGYYAALNEMEKNVKKNIPITEHLIQTLHALIMGGGRTSVRPTPYRDGQNVIRDSRSGTIVYLPPEARDVPPLMKGLISWIKTNTELPTPITAAIIHYQFATIHPYYDGNGRTARLLTTYLLHLRSYGLKGLYALEEYYAENLAAYYEALTITTSHNYYEGRAEADITKWLEYFCEGMAESFEKVKKRAMEAAASGVEDKSIPLRQLDPRQRRVLELFQEQEIITAKDIGRLFGFKPRTCSEICRKWAQNGFLVVADPSRKGRKYRLSSKYLSLLD